MHHTSSMCKEETISIPQMENTENIGELSPEVIA